MKILFLIGNPPIVALSEWGELKRYQEDGYFTLVNIKTYSLECHKVLKLTAQLEKWVQFRTTDWTTELDYPEYTAKEVGRFLNT